jgi:hypothetical protein
MRVFLAVLCWIGFAIAVLLGEVNTWFAGAHFVALMILYATWNVRQGRKWYGVFLLFVPVYSGWLVGKMFWSWAGSWIQSAAAAEGHLAASAAMAGQ